jgi:tetratricopeptide (TPR) repeat protein
MHSVSILEWVLTISVFLAIAAYIYSRIKMWQSMDRILSNKGYLFSRVKTSSKLVGVIRLILYTIVLVLIFATFAFPIGEEIPNSQKSEGVDILFIVDVSLSMNAIDASPSRLTRFKEVVLNLIPELQGNRLGIVVFAASPFLYCPLTTDLQAFSDYIRGLDVDIVGDKGTDLSKTFNKANSILESDRILRNRIVVLVSDGEDHDQPSIPNLNSQVIVWGIGEEIGSPIYYNDSETKSSGYVTTQGILVPRSDYSNVILSRADHDFLRKVAEVNRGQYFNLTKNGAGAYKLVDKIHDMEKNQMNQAKQMILNQKAYYYLLPAILILLFDYTLIEYLLFRRSIKKSIPILLIGIMFILGESPLQADSFFNPGGSKIEKGIESYNQDKIPEAIQSFETAEKDFPKDPRLDFNKGTALIKGGRPEEAIPLLEKSLEIPNNDQKSKSYYNLGKAYTASGQKRKALDAYRKALEVNPDLSEAKKNIELLYKTPPGNSQSPNQDSKESKTNSDDKSNSKNPSESSDKEEDSSNQKKESSEESQESQSHPQSQSTEKDPGKLSKKEAEEILDSLNPERIQRKKSKGLLQFRREKFW